LGSFIRLLTETNRLHGFRGTIRGPNFCGILVARRYVRVSLFRQASHWQ
jgi:hypothetical protein